MGNIFKKGNFFGVPHNIIQWKDDNGQLHHPLTVFPNSSLKLYIVLCSQANRYGETFYLDDSRLSTITDLSKRQLCRARAALRNLGLIKATARKDYSGTDYQIMVETRLTSEP